MSVENGKVCCNCRHDIRIRHWAKEKDKQDGRLEKVE